MSRIQKFPLEDRLKMLSQQCVDTHKGQMLGESAGDWIFYCTIYDCNSQYQPYTCLYLGSVVQIQKGVYKINVPYFECLKDKKEDKNIPITKLGLC